LLDILAEINDTLIVGTKTKKTRRNKMKTFKEIRKELKAKGVKITDAKITLNGEKAYNVYIEGGRILWNAWQIKNEYYNGNL